MELERQNGILLHPTSLPSRFGIGDLGKEAYKFIDNLYLMRQKLWQVLPLSPTGYGDSPYQCFSVFAGNTLLISPELLVEDGLLSDEDIATVPEFTEDVVEYGQVIQYKNDLFKKAFENFSGTADFDSFCEENDWWLDDYSLFSALKESHDLKPWNTWADDLIARKPEALTAAKQRLTKEIRCCKFCQYLFFKQWTKLKVYCNSKGISVIGDIPIFAAYDSADVWANQSQYFLNEKGSPTVVAGVPPDYFSATGQLWGNPLYRWDRMAEDGYSWWMKRFEKVLTVVDIVRLDHFRGFEAYWEVPAGDTTTANGRWMKGPGVDFFATLEKTLGKLPIIAENLGFITKEVEDLRNRFNLPGMAILQFAFGTDPQAENFKPHNYKKNLVAYTGTHDNDTTKAWWQGAGNESTRSQKEVFEERESARKYFVDVNDDEVNWAFIRTLMASVANVTIVPLQELFGLGNSARMNMPSRPNGNWQWRYPPELFTEEVKERMKTLTEVYERC
jgi:4-alpha-glucanotransferase